MGPQSDRPKTWDESFKRAAAYYEKHGGNSTILEIPEEEDANRQEVPTPR
mgnify:CR=1 FL=1